MKSELNIRGLHCAGCVNRLEKALRDVQGVDSASVSLLTEKAEIEHRPSLSRPALVKAVEAAGFGAEAAPTEETDHLRPRWIMALLVGAVLMARMLVEGHSHRLIDLVAAGVIQVWVGAPFYAATWRTARARATDMNTLVALGSTIAFVASAVAFFRHEDVYFESAVFILGFVTLGRWLESRARTRAGAALRGLLQAVPSLAHRLDAGGGETDAPLSAVRVGDRLRVRPGETVPVDGTIQEGASELDESLLTGESLPLARTVGERVIGGSRNGSGSFVMDAGAVGKKTVLANIARAVEKAQTAKPPVQERVDRVAAVFVPVILSLATLTFLGWWAAGQPEAAWRAAVAVLLIACPCALGLAVPVARMVGLGRAAELGILVRNPGALEKASRIDVVVLDKTGTVTEGKAVVTDVHGDEEDLRLAGALERRSEHPLARAVAERFPSDASVEDFRAHPGRGVEGTVDGHKVRAGSAAFLGQEAEDTRIFVEVDGRLAGWLRFSDPLRPDAAEAVRRLAQGREVRLFSGDRPGVVREAAQQLGIAHFQAAQLPEEKQAAVQELQRQGHCVAMAGDGLNDGPALAQADLSMALGWGSDLARETADVTLLTPRLDRLEATLRLSMAIERTIRQGLVWATLYNAVLVPVAAAGLLSPTLAASAMTLSSLSVVLNALRLRGFRA